MEIGILASIVTFAIGIVVYPRFIDFLQTHKVQQAPSEFALEEYKQKNNTVTFGGVIFVVLPVIIALIFRGLTLDMELYLVSFIYLAYAAIGFIDDYKIVKEGKNDGLTPRMKMGLQLILSLVFYGLYILQNGDNTLMIPFINYPVNLGFIYIPFVMFLFSGSSNAVNLTDGMDGLAGGTSLIALLPFAYFAYKNGSIGLFVLIMALCGALIAFLIFNRKPAKIFMGDVGSLALGAFFAAISIMLKKEIVFAIIGGVFVYETVCVIIQRVSWKLRKKRVFKYTPIHYSFTLSGWAEQDVVYFFYALGLVFMVLGFAVSALV